MDSFTCGVCNLQFETIQHFLAHKTQHDIRENDDPPTTYYKCQLCYECFNRRAALVQHYNSWHKISFVKSICCQPASKTNKRKLRKPHKSINVTEEDKCDNTLPLQAVSGEEANIDQLLDFYFTLTSETVKGSSLTYAKMLLACVYCTYKCTTSVDLNAHMQNYHLDLLSVPIDQQITPTGDNIMKMSEYLSQIKSAVNLSDESKDARRTRPARNTTCNICKKQFINAECLKRHRLEQHAKPKAFQCNICDYREATQWKLKMHMAKHKVFKCNECDFISTVKGAIRNHRQVHKNDSFVCDVCGKAYNLKDTLQKHKQVHDKSRPYACTFEGCTFRFKTERMCKGHLKTHYESSEGFPCPDCGYTFRHKHHLKRHMESAHNVPYIKRRGRMQQIETCEIPITSEQDVNDSLVLCNSEEESVTLCLAGLMTPNGVTSTPTTDDSLTQPNEDTSTTVIYIQSHQLSTQLESSVEDDADFVDQSQTVVHIDTTKDLISTAIHDLQEQPSRVIMGNSSHIDELIVDEQLIL